MNFNTIKTLSIFSISLFISGRSVAQEEKIEIKTASGTIITTQEADGEVFTIVDEPATYPGGIDSLKHFLATNLHYPYKAVRNKLEGKCYIQFIITDKGTVSNVEVKRGVPDCKECDAEGIRVIKAMPIWEPGKVNGKPVNSTFTLPISFKL